MRVVSMWRQVAINDLDKEVVAILMAIQREHFELYQSWPTPAQVLAHVQPPTSGES